MKVPVSNSAEFFSKRCPLEDFGGFGVVRVNPNPLGILAGNFPEVHKPPAHFWKHAFVLILSNFAPFEEVKVPVPKKCPLEDFAGFGVVRVLSNQK